MFFIYLYPFVLFNIVIVYRVSLLHKFLETITVGQYVTFTNKCENPSRIKCHNPLLTIHKVLADCDPIILF